jgi:esterase FrsA
MPVTMAETWAGRWQAAARRGNYPFEGLPFADVEAAMAKVLPAFDSGDREIFTREFARVAEPHAARAQEAEARGDRPRAKAEFTRAYGLYRLARFPCVNSPAKREAYGLAQDCILRAYAHDAAPIRRVEMPFAGKPGEGRCVVGYLRLPPGISKPPVLIAWAGIDSFKEDWTLRTEAFLAAGTATLAVDMPGTGDAPLLYSENAERMWDAIFAWIETQPDLDAARIGAWGGSDGGYWATKLAHTHRTRFKGVISQGGGAHILFTAEWIAKAQRIGNPWGIAETRGNAAGVPTYDGWVARAPAMSLLTQGVLDQPCAPLLCINGVRDMITPIEDYYLLLQHGSPKYARFYDGIHMGMTADGTQSHIVPVMVEWMRARLGH